MRNYENEKKKKNLSRKMNAKTLFSLSPIFTSKLKLHRLGQDVASIFLLLKSLTINKLKASIKQM